MLRKGDLAISHEPRVESFGISMKQSEYQEIIKNFNRLEERCPSQSFIKLHFEEQDSTVAGTLSVRSFSESFYSEMVGHNPYHCYKLLEEDIDQQLLEWKRRRFRSSIKKDFSEPLRNSRSA